MLFRCVYGMPLLLAAWIFAAMPARAAPVRFMTVELAPYGINDGQAGKRGLIVDIDAAIAARSGVAIVDSVRPIARVMKSLESGTADCAVFLRTAWSKARFIAVAKIYDSFASIVVSRKGLPIARISDLHGRLLALPRGSYVDFEITTDPEIKRHFTNGYSQSARMLKAGRVDAIAGTALSIYHNLAELQMRRKDLGSFFTFDRKPIWLQCTKKPDLETPIARLRRAANALRAEGVFRQLRESYVPADFK